LGKPISTSWVLRGLEVEWRRRRASALQPTAARLAEPVKISLKEYWAMVRSLVPATRKSGKKNRKVNFGYQFSVMMSSIDRAGVLFYPELFRHAHDAYEAFMAQLGQDLPGIFAAGDLHIPVVHAEADYLLPLTHGESVAVTVTAGGVGNSSFTIDCVFVDAQGRTAAKVRSVHVCIDPLSRQPAPLPAALREKLAAGLA
jgi:1,4-dihydroxy-2-naphthoyl-CoA hydrolase